MNTLISTWVRCSVLLALVALCVLPACEAQTDRPRVLGVARSAEAPDESVASPLHEVTASTGDTVPLVTVAIPSGKVTTAADNLAASTQAIVASGANAQPSGVPNSTLLIPGGAIGPRGTTELHPTGTRP